MSEFEVYVLCNERKSSLVRKFLNEYLPDRSELADDYPFPELVDNPEVVYEDVEGLMSKLDVELNEGYSIYWNNNISNSIIQAMLFYTEDGHMIIGLVVDNNRKDWLTKLSNYVSGLYGYTTQDDVPPETKDEFIARCKQNNDFKLVEGLIINS